MKITTEVAIVGAGLSGLFAAYQLEKAGISYVVLEGRPDTGGRILSCGSEGAGERGRVDLGATWIWPSFQPQLARLIDELDIATLTQAETGDMMYERDHNQSPARHPGYASSPASVRLAGGMRQLTERLETKINAAQLHVDTRVVRVEKNNDAISLHTLSADGAAQTFHARQILLALPPALAAGIEYVPALPAALTAEWSKTGTWMAPHAKYVAVYQDDFWRGRGLSGEARSGVGPMVEIHDASVPGGVSALFGFIGVPARARWTTSEDHLKTLCRSQLIRLFGENAAEPVAEYFKDWADDPFTATPEDLLTQAGHTVPQAAPLHGEWAGSLRGIASEWSPQFPGYLAGAVDAAFTGVELLSHRNGELTR